MDCSREHELSLPDGGKAGLDRFAMAQNRWALALFLALISHDGTDIWDIENPGVKIFTQINLTT